MKLNLFGRKGVIRALIFVHIGTNISSKQQLVRENAHIHV